jgi:hypothetical protein
MEQAGQAPLLSELSQGSPNNCSGVVLVLLLRCVCGSLSVSHHPQRAVTVSLWVLINKKLTAYPTAMQAQGLIHGGAFIDRQGGENNKYMVDDCREQEKRMRQANRVREADCCKRVAEMLEARATKLLTDACSKGDLAKVQLCQQNNET